jgi:hypothetical protein
MIGEARTDCRSTERGPSRTDYHDAEASKSKGCAQAIDEVVVRATPSHVISPKVKRNVYFTNFTFGRLLQA